MLPDWVFMSTGLHTKRPLLRLLRNTPDAHYLFLAYVHL